MHAVGRRAGGEAWLRASQKNGSVNAEFFRYFCAFLHVSPMHCLFVSDLHGHVDRYEALFAAIEREAPDVVLMGGDLFPHRMTRGQPREQVHPEFLWSRLVPWFRALREGMKDRYPHVLIILGNDDGRRIEGDMLRVQAEGVWEYLHGRCVIIGGIRFFGYSYVPPTPFLLKDWERHDITHHLLPGCIAPEDGRFTVEVDRSEVISSTIATDLDTLIDSVGMQDTICLFHSPPHGTALDRAALDGRTADGVPLDVHIGSRALRMWIERHQPLMTLHGHVHEAARLTGTWMQRLGDTVCVTAAHDGPGLALIRFDTAHPGSATRHLSAGHRGAAEAAGRSDG